MCVLPQSAILNKDLDKFKVSVSIFYGSVISKSSSDLCAFSLCACYVDKCLYICVSGWLGGWRGGGGWFISLALETIIAEIICFQGWAATVKG